jgi:predicted TIM-barrel fold metal-dependent hydrolase
MIDVNVSLSRWPFRRLPHDETPRLVGKLRRAGVTSAWAGSFEALLHRDVAGVNGRLVEECRPYTDMLVPFGTVNPTLPDWQDDLRRCHEAHGMPGIRLHPNYHGYTLADSAFAELLRLADERRLIVQLAVRMEDDRTQHPLVRVTDVDTKPLLELLPARPNLRVVILNGLRTLSAAAAAELAAAGRVWFEISMLEGVGGLERLVERVPVERLLFGSYFPFFVHESALLKLRESDLGEFRERAIRFGNAERVLTSGVSTDREDTHQAPANASSHAACQTPREPL